jgi:hypothetical protein
MSRGPDPRSSVWRTAGYGALGSVFSGATLTAGVGVLGGSSPLLLLAVPVLLAIVTILMLAPPLAFLAMSFIIPIERLGRLTDDNAMYTISLMRIVGTVALASFLLHALIRRQRLAFGLAFWLYVTYFGLAVLGVFHSSHSLGTVRACGAILGNLLFFWLVINAGRSPPLARSAVVVWLVSTVVMGVFTIVTWHFGQGASAVDLAETSSRFSTVLTDDSELEALNVVARATGPTSHSAVYAINLILALPLLFYFLRHLRSPLLKLLVGVGILITLYNVLLTNTRAAILLAAAVVAFCGVRGLYRVTAGRLVAAMVVAAMMLPLAPAAVWDRVLNLSNYGTERSATLRIRFDYWAAGIEVVKDHWLTGIGVGNQQVIPRYLKVEGPEETTVHNEYIQTAMEVGPAGWLVFFGFVALVYAAAVRAQRLAPRVLAPELLHSDFFVAIQISMLATLLFGLQVDVFHFPLKGWWLLAGVSWGLYQTMLDMPEYAKPKA